jgi:hypothetical protein
MLDKMNVETRTVARLCGCDNHVRITDLVYSQAQRLAKSGSESSTVWKGGAGDRRITVAGSLCHF